MNYIVVRIGEIIAQEDTLDEVRAAAIHSIKYHLEGYNSEKRIDIANSIFEKECKVYQEVKE